MIITIPDDILENIRLPKEDIEKELKKGLALFLYERGLASMGTARKVAGLSKWEFIESLAERGIYRHYGEKELMEDIKYAEG